MAGSGIVFNQTTTTPSMPSASEDALGPKAARKIPQSSTGACDACRLRKVRCLANESSSSSRCQRCARANRECVYTTHSKTRRRKRTDTRVKELEEKVRGLSMLLENGRANSGSSAEREMASVEEDEGWRRPSTKEADGLTPENEDTRSWNGFVGQPKPQCSETVMQKWVPESDGFGPDSTSPDVVERGLLSMDKATELVSRYTNHLLPHYPAVPISCNAHELRQTKPILFLAVLSASVEAADPILGYKLNQEIQQFYAKKIAIQGHKSLEMLQALCVSILWTYPPKRFEELKFHQQIHMAATMALDIGLAKRPKPHRDPYPTQPASKMADLEQPEDEDISHRILLERQAISRKRACESGSVDGRRALLACYVFCASVSMSLRLPNMLRFTNWMAECVEFLETSAEAVPTDRRFAAWVRLQRIVEECGISLGLDNTDDTVSLDDEHAQLMLKGAERQLAAWKCQVSPNGGILNDFLEICYHVYNVHLHEIALHTDHDADDFRPPFSLEVETPSRKRMSPPFISAIMVCISSSQRALDIFLGMGIEAVRASPTLLFVRISYLVVILMKLSTSSSTPSSDLGRILDSEDCKVFHYTEKTIAHMDAVASADNHKKHVLAFKFLHILIHLNGWFRKQTDQLNAKAIPTRSSGYDRDSQSKQTPDSEASPSSTSVPHYSNATTVSSAATPIDFEDLSQENYLAPSNPQSGKSGNFLYDNSRCLIEKAFASNDPEPAPAPLPQASPTWSTEVQASSEFQDQGYSFPSYSNGPFDFPMDIDPNLFSQLVNTELYEYSGGNVMLNGEDEMVYTEMPEIDWANWPLAPC